MGAKTKSWFWTPERLMKLRQVLDTACEQDDIGLYFGPISLSGYVATRGPSMGLVVTEVQAGGGLGLLVFLGGLERGVLGRKTAGSGYRRRYYPDKIADITWQDVNRYRGLRKHR